VHLSPELVMPAFFTATVSAIALCYYILQQELIGITLVFLWRSELVKQVAVTNIDISPLNFRI